MGKKATKKRLWEKATKKRLWEKATKKRLWEKATLGKKRPKSDFGKKRPNWRPLPIAQVGGRAAHSTVFTRSTQLVRGVVGIRVGGIAPRGRSTDSVLLL